MIKLVVFDLDGVLVEAKEMHYETLNQAIEKILSKNYTISPAEHLSTYDGLKTKQKLEMLTINKNLPVHYHDRIWELKQSLTLQAIYDLEESDQLKVCMRSLVEAGVKIACCSNSIRKTVLTVLSKLGIIEYFDLIISNEDVINSKPHPEMYWKAMSKIGVLPEETLIVEDSPYGLLAASRAKAHILRVGNPEEVTYNNIFKSIQQANSAHEQHT